jgi:hypothetical protein
MESLLVDWANSTTVLSESWNALSIVNALEAMRRKYPEFFDSFPRDTTNKVALLTAVQSSLRMAWDASDLRQREWFIFSARHAYQQYTAVLPLRVALSNASAEEKPRIISELTAAESAAPALTPFERVAWHFHRIADRARRCAHVECPAPYFFAESKNQKYCSLDCSAPALRQQKRTWFRENRGKGKSQ